MSRDFRPIEHIIANIDLMLEGNIKEFMFEHPYIEMNYQDGRVVPLTDKECSERFPYVTFFTLIHNSFQENKDNPIFIEKVSKLEKDLRQIVDNIYNDLKEPNTKAHEDKWFDNLSGEFDDLKDFILSENEYEFSYNSERSQNLFAENFMNEFEKTVYKEQDKDLSVPDKEIDLSGTDKEIDEEYDR